MRPAAVISVTLQLLLTLCTDHVTCMMERVYMSLTSTFDVQTPVAIAIAHWSNL